MEGRARMDSQRHGNVTTGLYGVPEMFPVGEEEAVTNTLRVGTIGAWSKLNVFHIVLQSRRWKG